MTEPKRNEPQPDHPEEDGLFLESQETAAAAGEENPLDALGLSASTEEFHFPGPVEDLDFTEPSDFSFPEAGAAEVVLEATGGGEAAGTEAVASFDSFAPAEAAVESEVAGEGVADLEAAEEGEGEEKPKFQLPAWARTAEWIAVGLLGAAALVAVLFAVLSETAPARATLILNIGCPVMLALIPYALWRSSAHWVTPAGSALYTVMLALSTAALITGTWCVGLELSRYDWQYSKTRVRLGKPPIAVIAPLQPKTAEKADPAAK